MNNNLNQALKESLQDIVDAGLKTTFTNKRLNELGVTLPVIEMAPSKIQKIRKRTKLSQAVFAQLLNVSLNSVRSWEQGVREPTGSTKVLLDLLNRDPHVLDHMLPKEMVAA